MGPTDSLVLITILLGKTSLNLAGDPPYLASEMDWEAMEVAAGSDRTLRCPVMNTRFYRWYLDHTELTETLHPEYQLQGRRLVIRSFSGRQQGKYTCRGVNGYGTVSYSFLLSLRGQSGAPVRQDVLVEGMLVNRTVTEGSRVSLTCHLQSLQELSLVWARRLEADHSLPGTAPLIHLGQAMYRRLQPSSNPRLEVSDKFLLGESGLRYEYSLEIMEARREDSGQYVCVVFSEGTPVDHQAAHLTVTSVQQDLPKPPSLSNLTIVLAVLGSVVLLLLIVLLILLCHSHTNRKIEPKRKRNIPNLTKESHLKVQDDLDNFI